MPPRALRVLPAVTAMMLATQAAAQGSAAPRRSWLEATAGSDVEEYLRAIQLDSTLARPYPQTIRAFGWRELARMRGTKSAGPWAAAFDTLATAKPLDAMLLRPAGAFIVNTGFPFGMNDGAVWAGRGVTTMVRAGGIVRVGPVTARLEPIAFRAENARFDLFDNGKTGDARFRDALEPFAIDQPQRFGSAAYQRVDLGESELRVDGLGVTAGISNANEIWGPAVTHPLILGANAAGFIHLFAGTAAPVPIFIGRVHARVIAGRLEQSAYSPAPDSLAVRRATGIVVSFQPRGLGGLELGGTRFFHRRWEGWSNLPGALASPLEGLLFKRGQSGIDDPSSPQYLPDNQLASAFFRWPFAGAGFEFYGEFARNDASVDLREFGTEPDHDSAYLLGFRRLLHRRDGGLLLVRGEWVNSRITHLARVRPQARFYQHAQYVQGHTSRGEVLGSVDVLGGGGVSLGADLYDARGRSSLDLHRILRLTPLTEGAADAQHIDVQHAVVLTRSAFVRGIDVTAGLTGVWEMNRNFVRDAFNLGATLGVRLGEGARPAAR